jgi:hypothetical protein
MPRTPQNRAKDLPSKLLASNPALLIGTAFEIGMLLGRRSGRTAMGRKVRDAVSDVVEQAVQLTPDALVKLVPQLVPAKPRPRRRSARK